MNLHHTTSNLLFVQFDISITSRLVSHDYRLSRSTQQMELIYKRGILKFMFLFTACKNQFESHDQVFLLMLRFFSVIIRYIFFSFCLFSFFFAVVVNETIYYNKKKHNNLGTGYNNEKKFSLYVWPVAHYIYIKISISTSCSEITIIWYRFYLLTSYFEKLSTWIYQRHKDRMSCQNCNIHFWFCKMNCLVHKVLINKVHS